MMNQQIFWPEGCAPAPDAPASLEEIRRLIEEQTVVEGTAVRCDRDHTLHVNYRGFAGLLPRSQAVHPSVSGAQREISVLSRVGRPIQFVITGLTTDGGGKPTLQVSRSLAQEKALRFLREECPPGTVLRGWVTHLAPFGAFVDVGCGVVALLPTAYLSAVRGPPPLLPSLGGPEDSGGGPIHGSGDWPSDTDPFGADGDLAGKCRRLRPR